MIAAAAFDKMISPVAHYANTPDGLTQHFQLIF
jgi:hypothetical protein